MNKTHRVYGMMMRGVLAASAAKILIIQVEGRSEADDFSGRWESLSPQFQEYYKTLAETCSLLPKEDLVATPVS